jgi:hypothetical protein
MQLYSRNEQHGTEIRVKVKRGESSVYKLREEVAVVELAFVKKCRSFPPEPPPPTPPPLPRSVYRR